MAHYNLYEALGLDRANSPSALAAELDARLNVATDPAMRDQLQVARRVLGDDQRRSLYDARLADPSAPTITIPALRQLATLDLGTKPDPMLASGQPAAGGPTGPGGVPAATPVTVPVVEYDTPGVPPAPAQQTESSAPAEPEPDPVSGPAIEPAPAPVSASEPEPALESDPQPAIEPEPEPPFEARPETEGQTSAAFSPEVESAGKPEPDLEDAPKPATEVALEQPATEDVLEQPASEVALERPATEVAPEPATEAAPEIAPELEAEPEPDTQTVQLEKIVGEGETAIMSLQGRGRSSESEGAGETEARPRQSFPETDPEGKAVEGASTSRGPVIGYPGASYPRTEQAAPYGQQGPQYGYYGQQPYGAPYPAPQPAPAPAEPKKRGARNLPLILGIALLVAALAGGGWWMWDRSGSPWTEAEQEMADDLPSILPEKEGQRGWQGLKCKGMEPEDGQEARIRCANNELGISVIDYGNRDSRNSVVSGTPDVIGNDECTAKSYEIPGANPPAYQIAPETENTRYLIIINGEDAEEMRLRLNPCQ